jgi:nickel/cobalt transporter (NiCoT) family protein
MDSNPNDRQEESPSVLQTSKAWYRRYKSQLHNKCAGWHAQTPYLRRLPLRAILIITFLIAVNLVVWAICGLILSRHTHLLGTAALAYSLGLRHALDADHISAIDLMTRRLIATGQKPVTVGTFFSLGHSTIVVITSIVVAATAAGIAGRFDSFGTVGGIIGTSVSAAFLILLGIMNAYILYKLIMQIKKIIRLQPGHEAAEAWKVEGGGVFFRLLKRMFKLIDRPWKMYPLGVLFGMGFDTSSEIALLGISSIQGAKGTPYWLILIFPVLFTAGMCLVDTTDGALMMSLYVAPMGMTDNEKGASTEDVSQQQGSCAELDTASSTNEPMILTDIESVVPPRAMIDTPAPTIGPQSSTADSTELGGRVKDPLTFLYYSIVLTTLTVICAIVIGVIQLLSLVLNVANPKGHFWDGVAAAGDSYEIIGGAICGMFIIVGGLSTVVYKPWRRWVDKERVRLQAEGELHSPAQPVAEDGPQLADPRHVAGIFVISEDEEIAGDADKAQTSYEEVGGNVFDDTNAAYVNCGSSRSSR